MVFCETRLTKDIKHLYKLEDYNLFSNNRNHYGGGVCLYVKRHITSMVCDDLCIMNEYIETLFIEATYLHTQVLIRIIYRRPMQIFISF